MSKYIYHSELPEPPDKSETPAKRKEKSPRRHNIRLLLICMFVMIAALTFTAVLILSSSFSSINENADNSAAESSSASADHTVEPLFVHSITNGPDADDYILHV